MSTAWLDAANHVEMLTGFLSVIALALVFARLQLLAATTATRFGLVACGLQLLVWLVFGTLWLAGQIPIDPLPSWVFEVWDLPHFITILWATSIVAFNVTLLALALTLHRGIQPREEGPR